MEKGQLLFLMCNTRQITQQIDTKHFLLFGLEFFLFVDHDELINGWNE